MTITGYINGEHCTFTSLRERLAVQNADKIALLHKFIDNMAENTVYAGKWNFKDMKLIVSPDGIFDFKIYNPEADPFRIDYSHYYSRIGTPKPTFIASKLVIKDVIFNPPATIVFWNDGTKTVVKAHDELFDWEKGLAMAICKKYLSGNKGRYYNVFREYEKAGIEAEYKCGARIF